MQLASIYALRRDTSLLWTSRGLGHSLPHGYVNLFPTANKAFLPDSHCQLCSHLSAQPLALPFCQQRRTISKAKRFQPTYSIPHHFRACAPFQLNFLWNGPKLFAVCVFGRFSACCSFRKLSKMRPQFLLPISKFTSKCTISLNYCPCCLLLQFISNKIFCEFYQLLSFNYLVLLDPGWVHLSP